VFSVFFFSGTGLCADTLGGTTVCGWIWTKNSCVQFVHCALTATYRSV